VSDMSYHVGQLHITYLGSPHTTLTFTYYDSDNGSVQASMTPNTTTTIPLFSDNPTEWDMHIPREWLPNHMIELYDEDKLKLVVERIEHPTSAKDIAALLEDE